MLLYPIMPIYVCLCWPVSPEMQTDTGPGKISMMDECEECESLKTSVMKVLDSIH